MIEITLNNASVLAAFNRLIQLGEDFSPVLREIGEDVTERSKRRFETSTAPDGTPWAPNSDTTLRNLLHGNDKNFTKAGKLSARGNKVLAGKKPLIGESLDLSRKIAPHYDHDSVTITASPLYAAIQQFGGKKSQFPNLWGDIPARPFLPVTQDKQLYPEEEHQILDVFNKHIRRAMGE